MEQVVDPTADFRKQHEKFLEDAKSALKTDRQRADLFAAMLRSPAWELYVAMLNSMIQMRGDEVLAPGGSMEKLIGLEFIKGSMNGLILARDLPRLIIDVTPAPQSEEE